MSDAPATPLGPGGEFERLRAVFARLGPRLGDVGDDAALVSVDGAALALSCDLSVEGRHFRRQWLTPEEIGWRAGAAALSDLAAVAAEPLGVLAAVGIPEGGEGEFLEALMDGLAGAAERCGARVWGGDLVRASEVTVDVTVVGRATRPVRRRGAGVGDGVWVTGALGGPAAAIAAWESGAVPVPLHRQRFARPLPRVAESWWLRDHGATAMLDISDGLVGDAGHLAAASGVGVEIEVERVPVVGEVGEVGGEAEAAEAAAAAGLSRGLRFALQGGEEYELLVALPASFGEAEVPEFEHRFRLALTRVGTVREGAGVTVLRGGQPIDVGGGFSHF